MADTEACDHNCACGHMQADHSSSGFCNACRGQCEHNDGHYPDACWQAEPPSQANDLGLHHCPHCTDAVVDLEEHWKTCTALKEDKLAEARRLLAEDEAARTQACADEIQAVLAKHGMRLQITQPQLAIVPAQ